MPPRYSYSEQPNSSRGLELGLPPLRLLLQQQEKGESGVSDDDRLGLQGSETTAWTWPRISLGQV